MRPSGIGIDPKRKEPLHVQIFDQVVARIRSRAFPEGHRLPPTRDLARELNAHRNTVVRAYADLEAAGYVRSRVGQGTFVAPLPQPASRAAPAEAPGLPWASLLSSLAVEPLARMDRAGRASAPHAAVAAPWTATGGAINLSRMQPSEDLLPDDLIRRCVDHVLRVQGGKALGYAPPEGVQRLRGLIAEDLARQGVPARAEDVVVTTGSQQALDLIARALINPGDTVLVNSTTYSGAIHILGANGARLVPVPGDGEGPDLESLQRLARSGAKAMYLMPNCNNPTGECVGAARRQALVAWARDAGVPLIEDDYGADLGIDGQPPPPALRAFDGDVLYVSTFSKRLAPALRVGFLVCPPPLLPVITSLKHAMDLGTSALLQHALAEFLERGYLEAHVNRILPEYRARRERLLATLRAGAPKEVRWRRPERGVVLWLELPEGLDPELVAQEAGRRGVIVSPSWLFAADPRPPRGVRLTFCAEPEPRVGEGGRRLCKALKALLAARGDEARAGAPGLDIV